jgi:septal ring factor EnvC (AmiA/AmiB activator)
MLKKFAAAALMLSLAVPAFAAAPSDPAATPGLDKREARMEKRIEQGKASGALNEKEAARLEKRKAKLEQAEERAKADGQVTRQERRHLNRKADKVSQDISQQKRDKQTAVPAPEAVKQ